MQTPNVAERVLVVFRANGEKAYVGAPPRIRQSDCDRFGGYEAARRALGRA